MTCRVCHSAAVTRPSNPRRPRLLARPTGKRPDRDEMNERVMRRFSKTMEYLAESERRERDDAEL
ncbi:MAG: hypothetical protein WBR13_07325 [Allosphingosinicella sp.]